MPVDTPVTSSHVQRQDGAQPVVRAAGAGQLLSAFADLPAYASQVPVYKALDVSAFPGSATTETTVSLSDGSHDFTITRTNIWDDHDVTYENSGDLANIPRRSGNPDGIAPVTIDQSTSRRTSRRHASRLASSPPPYREASRRRQRCAGDVARLRRAEPADRPRHPHAAAPARRSAAGSRSTAPATGTTTTTSTRRQRAHRSAAGGDRRSPERRRPGRAARAGAYQQRHPRRLPGRRCSPRRSPLEGIGATTWFVNGDLSLNADQMLLQGPAPRS